jgi:hypothetical protein
VEAWGRWRYRRIRSPDTVVQLREHREALGHCSRVDPRGARYDIWAAGAMDRAEQRREGLSSRRVAQGHRI